MTYLIGGGLLLAALVQLRVNWLNKHDLCEPTANQCIKPSAGHLDRHHGVTPVPYHATCPR